MEGGVGSGGGGEGYQAQFTWTAFLCCLTAASGGALFGYDNGECIFTCSSRSLHLILRKPTARFRRDAAV